MPTEAEPLPNDQPDWSGQCGGPAPAFLIDIERGLLVDSNCAGRRLWWDDHATPALPIYLDRSMPALRILRACSDDQVGSGDLLFWTQRGPVSLACAWHGLAAAEAAHVVVAVAADDVARSRSPMPASPGGASTPPLTSRLAHELRTPLGAVLAYADVLAQEHFGPLNNPRYRDYARSIRDSAQHALGVLEQMTAGGPAGENRTKELRFRDIDPAGIVEGCMTVMRPLAARAGVLLGVTFPVHLPRIVADEVTVRQMLLNLLTNAVKFARRGDRVRLAVTLEHDGGLTFAVEDTGPGLDAADSPDATVRSAKGLGIGLPLTRQLAEANGALFAIESAPGLGTRASISFGKARVVPV